MHVLYPNDLQARRQQRVKTQRKYQRRRRRTRFTSGLLAIVLLVTGLGAVGYAQPISAVEPSLVALPSETIAPLSLPWPPSGQAAVGAVDMGVLDEHNAAKPKPIASTAKIITALVVLEQKPLHPGQQGPNITFTAADEAIYNSYISRGGSVYPVTAGDSISQRQAMEALLIMSANNIADLLAVWAYGSMAEYVKAANEYIDANSISDMTISDASGFSPKTVGTASDLVLAGELLMKHPTLAPIVRKKSLTIPGLGDVPSTNILLGGNVVGIKTGNTDEAGGCFVIAVTHTVDGQAVTIVAAAMGAKDVPSAMATARAIALDARSGFELRTIVAKDTEIARYTLPWSETVSAVAQEDLRDLVWLPGSNEPHVGLNELEVTAAAGDQAGLVWMRDDSAQVNVVLKQDFSAPPLFWQAFGRFV